MSDMGSFRAINKFNIKKSVKRKYVQLPFGRIYQKGPPTLWNQSHVIEMKLISLETRLYTTDKQARSETNNIGSIIFFNNNRILLC